MTKVIGLTGGIGSGKTMIAKYIQELGVPVYIADDQARKLMDSQQIIDAVAAAFGTEILENGKLNRKKIADLVFNDPEKLQQLNSIVHPQVKNHFEQWLQQHQQYPFIVKEVAILFETGGDKNCDAVITVTAPLETRLQRVIARDETDRESVLKRMQSQWTDQQRIAKSDYTIDNISVKETFKQIKEILKSLKNQ